MLRITIIQQAGETELDASSSGSANASGTFGSETLDPAGLTAGPPISANEFIENQEAERRARESDEIASRFGVELAKRGHRSNFSPEYLASLPISMAAKLRVTPEEEEEVLYLYASTSSLRETAEQSGVPLEKVRAIVYSPASQDSLAALRQDMRISVISKIEETQTILLSAMQSPRKLDDSSITQLSSVFAEISQTQLQLISASRELAGSSAALANPTDVFSGDELEYMAFLRRRLSPSASSPNSEAVGLPSGTADSAVGFDEFSGHEFIDPDFVSASGDNAHYPPFPTSEEAESATSASSVFDGSISTNDRVVEDGDGRTSVPHAGSNGTAPSEMTNDPAGHSGGSYRPD